MLACLQLLCWPKTIKMQVSPGLLRNKAIRNYLAQYTAKARHQMWGRSQCFQCAAHDTSS